MVLLPTCPAKLVVQETYKSTTIKVMRPPQSQITLPGRGISRTLNSIVLQSPLAGITDQVFRKLVRRWAPDCLLFTEMVNASHWGPQNNWQKMRDLSSEEGPVGVQLFDHRPQALVEAAQKAEDFGAFLIDINMGCPAKKIARKGGGSALLKDPLLAAQIVKDVSNAVRIPVTVKARLGWCEKSSDPINLGRLLQDAGAQLLTLHGRTKTQRFKGNANWSAINEVKKSLKIPLIANGDISNCNDAFRCLNITQADGVMIGRASIRAPWIVGQINSFLQKKKPIQTPGGKERILISIELLNNLLEIYGSGGLFISRKYIKSICTGFQGSSHLCNSLIRADTPRKAIAILENSLLDFN